MVRVRNVVISVFAFILTAISPAAAQVAIGTAERIQGDVRGTVAGAEQPVAAGSAIFLNQVIATGADARAALRLEDGTTLTVGENAEVTLDAFVYDPAGKSTLSANVVGAFRYVSGKIEPGATRAATVTTPAATIGVRGTDFWGGAFDGVYGVVVLEGSVTVTPPGGESVTLDAAGMGVDIAGSDTTAPVIWGDARRERSLATVSFE